MPSTLHKCWMEDRWASISNRPLWQIPLPGAHDAGTYAPEGSLGGPWISAQGANIYQQLTYGMRYFDLRFDNVGFMSMPYWDDPVRRGREMMALQSGIVSDTIVSDLRRGCIVYHGLWKFPGTNLESILDQVRSFLNETKREIIILDIRMTADTHKGNSGMEPCVAA